MKKIPPPLVMFVGLFAEWLIYQYWPIASLSSTILVWIGYALIIFAVVLAFAALGLFRQQKTTVVPHGKPSQLVASGPYGFTRNPMYLSLTSVLLGVAALLGSLSPFLVPIAFVAYIDRAIIPMEESNMVEKFGDEYKRYAKRVRRWL